MDTNILNPTPEAPEAPEAPAAPAADVIDPKSFLESLPQDLRTNEKLNRIGSVADLAKEYLEGQSYISSSTRIPKDDASPEEWKKFYEKIGTPSKPEDYTVAIPEDFIKEGTDFKLDEKALTDFKAFAKEQNLTNTQAQKALEFYAQREVENLDSLRTSINTTQEENIKKLQQAWRGDYDKNINTINNGLTRMFTPESIEILKETGLLNKAEIIKDLLSLTKMAAGDTLYIDGKPVANVHNNIEALREQRDKLMSTDAEYKRNHAEVMKLNAEITKLVLLQRAQTNRRG
jgi:hypothetical protein